MAFPGGGLLFLCCWGSACILHPGGLNGSVTSGFGQRACVSHLTAAEALDFGEVPSLSKGLTISLIGGKRRTWRPRRLIRSTSNRSHLIPHSPSQGKHMGQRRRHVRLRNTRSRPLGTIHHGEHLLGTLILVHREGLLKRSVYVAGRTEAVKVRAHLNQC